MFARKNNIHMCVYIVIGGIDSNWSSIAAIYLPINNKDPRN